MNSVVYTANLDKGEAWWTSEDVKVDDWTRQFFPEAKRAAIDDILPDKHGDHYLRATAPVAPDLKGLRCETVRDDVADGKRRITLRVRAEDAPVHARLKQTQGPGITNATVNGAPLKADGGQLTLDFSLFAQDGYELVLETTPGAALSFEADQEVYGFPNVPGITPRPDYMITENNIMRNGISLRGQHMYVKNTLQVAAEAIAVTAAAAPAQ